MLEKQVVVDLIETLENGTIQIRTATKIMDDGFEVSRTFHRHVIVPGQDYIQEDARVQAICAAIHTPEVIAAYQAELKASKPVEA
jgi:hypothetical protein